MPPKKPLPVEDLMTPQEHEISGSTPGTLPRSDHPEDWHTPISILSRKLSIQDTINARKEAGHSLIGSGIAGIIGIRNASLVLNLVDLDPETGQTLEDPVIGGLWNKETKQIEGADQGRELTQKLYDKFNEYKMDLHLRPSSSSPEGQQGINPEQR